MFLNYIGEIPLWPYFVILTRKEVHDVHCTMGLKFDQENSRVM